MIIWLDGTYGVGKTSVAHKIIRNNKEIELIESDECFLKFAKLNLCGILFGGTLPQNNLSFLKFMKETIEEKIIKDVLVVMALTTKEAEETLYGYFKEKEVDQIHIILEANKSIILDRINYDNESRDKQFAISHLDDNLNYLANHYVNAIRIDTSGMCIEEVAGKIENILGR